MRPARWAAALAVLAATVPAAVAGADSFTPVRLQITIAPVARLHQPLAITVHVGADPGALDDRTGPMRIHVKLARECGGTYQYTTGLVLLNRQLSPQPSTGHAYTAVVHGSGRPTAYGSFTVCAFLDDDYETFETDTSTQVDVSKSCTVAAARYDAARRARRRKSKVAADRRAARRACGSGVPL